MDMRPIYLNSNRTTNTNGKANDKVEEEDNDSNSSYTMQLIDVSQPVTASFAPNTPFNQQLHPILIRIEVNGIRQWKVYRDDIGVYTTHNQASTHFPAEHIINIKQVLPPLTASYHDLFYVIDKLAPRKERPGRRGIENARSYHRLAVDDDGYQLLPGVKLTGRSLASLTQKLKVSSEIELRSVGVLVDLPGGKMGYVEIDGEDEGHCGTVLKLIARRGWKDVLVANYFETGKKLRF